MNQNTVFLTALQEMADSRNIPFDDVLIAFMRRLEAALYTDTPREEYEQRFKDEIDRLTNKAKEKTPCQTH